MATVLDTILVSKRREVADAKVRTPARDLERRLADVPPPRPFAAALSSPDRVAVIAEVKKASPSAGVLRSDFDPVAIATAYAAHGAACISVLTDGPFFQGHLDHLMAVRGAVEVPVLRKDFVVEAYQLLEARAAGADAVLLIAEALPDPTLVELLRATHALGMEALVELHDREQLLRVVASGAAVIGINNRDLRTFATRLDHTLDLAPLVPDDRILVSESGVRTREDIERLRAGGVDAVLVGETLMRSVDVGAALRALSGDANP